MSLEAEMRRAEDTRVAQQILRYNGLALGVIRHDTAGGSVEGSTWWQFCCRHPDPEGIRPEVVREKLMEPGLVALLPAGCPIFACRIRTVTGFQSWKGVDRFTWGFWSDELTEWEVARLELAEIAEGRHDLSR